MARLNNVKVLWAAIQEPDTKFQHNWHITAILSEEDAKRLKAESAEVDPKGKGIKFDEDQEGNKTYKFKRNVDRADGKGTNQKPLVCGPGGKNDLFTALVGNGSVCNIQYAFIPYNNKFGKGVTCDLKGVQVLEHVPYGVQDGDEFDSEDTSSSKDSNSYNDDDDFS